MNIRPARAIDAPAIAEMFAARVQDSTYAERDEVDVPLARKLFANAAFRHGHTNEGGTFLMVAEDDDGKIAAFILGSIGRVYGIGKKLSASDHYLVGRADVSARTFAALFDAYVDWASSNPRVIEIGASFSDAFPGAEAMGSLYARRGFSPCATTFRRIVPVQSKAEAA